MDKQQLKIKEPGLWEILAFPGSLTFLSDGLKPSLATVLMPSQWVLQKKNEEEKEKNYVSLNILVLLIKVCAY